MKATRIQKQWGEMSPDEQIVEMNKCAAEPWYFYNKYILIDGKPVEPKLTKETWEEHIKVTKSIRNG